MGTSGLGALLVEEGLLTEADRRTIKRSCGSHGSAFARSIIAMGLLDEDELAAFLAERTPWRVAPKELFKESRQDVWGIIDRPLVERLEVLPLKLENGTLHVAVVDPLDQDTIRQLAFFTGYKIHPVISTISLIRAGLKKLLKGYKPQSSQLELFLVNHAGAASRRLRMKEKRKQKPAAAAHSAANPNESFGDDVLGAEDGDMSSASAPGLEYPDSVNAAEDAGAMASGVASGDAADELGGLDELSNDLGSAPDLSDDVDASEESIGQAGADTGALDLGDADLEGDLELGDLDVEIDASLPATASPVAVAAAPDLGNDLDADLSADLSADLDELTGDAGDEANAPGLAPSGADDDEELSADLVDEARQDARGAAAVSAALRSSTDEAMPEGGDPFADMADPFAEEAADVAKAAASEPDPFDGLDLAQDLGPAAPTVESLAAESAAPAVEDDLDAGELSLADLESDDTEGDLLAEPVADDAVDASGLETASAAVAESVPDSETPAQDGASLLAEAAALNRALMSMTMARDGADAVHKAAPALVQAGLVRGLVLEVEGGKAKALCAWDQGNEGIEFKQDGLASFVTPGLPTALQRLFAGWTEFDTARDKDLKPFASWVDASGQRALFATLLPATDKRQIAVITAWDEATRLDSTIRTMALDIFRRVAQRQKAS